MLFLGAFAIVGERGVRRQADLDVLLITIDTLRADALGCYGDSRGTTPWIDRLAAGGVLFESAHAHNVLTLPSHSNILSGRYPFEHGVRENAGFRFPQSVETLATLLEKAGYSTAAFVSGFTVDSRFGLGRGFDVYEDSFADGRSAIDFRLPERRGFDTVALARRWLAEPRETPAFAWVHLYDPHAPYSPPEPYASRFPSAPYLGEVAAADAALAGLLEPLFDVKRADTLVVLTADHGEGLGDHGEKTHAFFAYETTLRVPLILHAPGVLPARRVQSHARHVDILPTLLDALSLPRPRDLPGHSLLPAIDGVEVEDSPSYFEALSGMLTRGWAPLYGVVAGGKKFIDLPLPELYDLVADPREQMNRIAREARSVDTLQRALDGLRSQDAGIELREESAETLDRLAALGYLSGAAALPDADAEYTEADDPKTLIALDARMQEVIALQLAGDLEGALKACRDVVSDRPQMNAAHVQLAAIYRKLGRSGDAAETLRHALAQSPDLTNAVLLAVTLSDAGEFQEAVDLLEPYVAREEPNIDALNTRAAALAQLGQNEEALVDFRRSRDRDPSNPMTRVQIATVELAAGNRDSARSELEAAIRLNPRLGLAHHTLGLVASASDDASAAESHFRHALELEPANPDTLLNLGLLLVRTGRALEAGRYLQGFLAIAPPAIYAAQIGQVRRWQKAGNTPAEASRR
jgi:arylsulfatase A-like enzyme/lipoprotein NlpI